MPGDLKLYTLFVPEIKSYLRAKDFWTLKKILIEIPPIELAEGWPEFGEEEKIIIFRLLTSNAALQIFEELEEKEQEFLLANTREPNLAKWISAIALEEQLRLFGSRGERFFRQLQAQAHKKRLFSHLPQTQYYPAGSAGALMRHEFFCVDPTWKAKMALERLQATARLKNVGELYALYVTTENRLLGILSLRTLIAAPPDSRVAEIMWPAGLLKVHPEMDQEEVAMLFSKYDLASVPVVNQDNKLIGTVVIDDVLNVLHQEATEDIAKMAGTEAAEITKMRIRNVVFLRMPWLVITCAGQFLVSHIIKSFEGTLTRFIALASFMPFIAAMGGNIGTQSSTIAVRALATGEWKSSDFGRSLKREFAVGGTLGLVYAILAGTLSFALYGDRFGHLFPLTVAAGMMTSMATAAILGAVEPFIFHRLKIDPATATGPLVTTMTDLISVATYLFVASIVLK
ncbi:MAG: magnesium transporter [Elusimicrobia bacterium]|nr:magnesium transporter [Elusimicrobiota bacterium]